MAWRRRWQRQIAMLLEASDRRDVIPSAPVEYPVFLGEAQPWGAVIWRTTVVVDRSGVDCRGLRADRLIVTDPQRSVRPAHRAARGVKFELVLRPADGLFGQYGLRSVLATGFGLVAGTAIMAQVGPVTPSILVDAAIAAGGGALAYGGEKLIADRHWRRCRLLTADAHGDSLRLASEIGVRLGVSDELRVMVLPELREILWEADHVGRPRTADRLARLHAAVTAVMPDPAAHAEQLAAAARVETPRQLRRRLSAAVEREHRDEDSEYVDGRLDSLLAWLDDRGRHQPSRH